MLERQKVWACECTYVRETERMCVCVLVSVCMLERQRECVCVCVSVCMLVRETERDCVGIVSACMLVRETERMCVCVCVCVCECMHVSERDRERLCVHCECITVSGSGSGHLPVHRQVLLSVGLGHVVVIDACAPLHQPVGQTEVRHLGRQTVLSFPLSAEQQHVSGRQVSMHHLLHLADVLHALGNKGNRRMYFTP